MYIYIGIPQAYWTIRRQTN